MKIHGVYKGHSAWLVNSSTNIHKIEYKDDKNCVDVFYKNGNAVRVFNVDEIHFVNCDLDKKIKDLINYIDRIEKPKPITTNF